MTEDEFHLRYGCEVFHLRYGCEVRRLARTEELVLLAAVSSVSCVNPRSMAIVTKV